jgi:hypothetical protein
VAAAVAERTRTFTPGALAEATGLPVEFVLHVLTGEGGFVARGLVRPTNGGRYRATSRGLDLSRALNGAREL